MSDPSSRPRPALTEITLAAAPAAWHALGFTVTGGAVRLGSVVIRLTGPPDAGGPGGITGWTLAGEGVRGEGPIDGLPTTRTTVVPPAADGPGPAHENGATRLDHVVVLTPALDRTLAALTDAGLDLRRIREAGRGLRQAFFRLHDDVIVEVGGDVPDVPAADPARFWGLVAVVPDVDALADRLGPDLAGAPKDAVQPGRRIVTVRREAGAGVPLAFLTPHVRAR